MTIYYNATNDISMKNDESFIHKYYAPFLSSKNNEDVSSGSEYVQLNKKKRMSHQLII